MPTTLLKPVKPELHRQPELEEFAFPDQEITEKLIRAVQARTGRKIGNLRIDLSPTEIVLHGCTRAYYYKQLASHAILEEMPGMFVGNEIEVI